MTNKLKGGMIRNIIVGLLGGVVGGVLFGIIGLGGKNMIGSLLIAVVGSCVILFAGKKLFNWR